MRQRRAAEVTAVLRQDALCLFLALGSGEGQQHTARRSAEPMFKILCAIRRHRKAL